MIWENSQYGDEIFQIPSTIPTMNNEIVIWGKCFYVQLDFKKLQGTMTLEKLEINHLCFMKHQINV